MEQEEKSCDEVVTVQEFTYPSDRVSAGGGSEADVTAKTKCGWVKLRECGGLNLESAVSYCIAGDFLQSLKGLFIRVAQVQQYCIEVKHGA